MANKSNSAIETIAIRDLFGDHESMLWHIGQGNHFAHDMVSGAMTNVRSAVLDHLQRVAGAAADHLAVQQPVHREQDERYDADVSSNGKSSPGSDEETFVVPSVSPGEGQVGQGQRAQYDADVSSEGCSPIPAASSALIKAIERPEGLEVLDNHVELATEQPVGLGIAGVEQSRPAEIEAVERPAELETVERPVELETAERPVEMPALEQPLRPEHLSFIAEEFGEEEAHRWYEGHGRQFAHNRAGDLIFIRAEVFEHFQMQEWAQPPVHEWGL